MMVDEIADGHQSIRPVVLGRRLLLSGSIVGGSRCAVHVFGPSSVGI